MKQAKNKIDRLSLVLSIIAILAISGIGSFLLHMEAENNSIILQPYMDEIYEQPTSDEQLKININTATKEELMLLDGIGESKAESIVSYRQTHTFVSTKDIMKVSGIGEDIYNKIANKICVE